MEVFVAQILNGIKLGGIYSVAVLGYNLLILTTGILHLGYASLLVLSMYAAWLVFGVTMNSLPLGIGASVISGVLLSCVTAPIFLPLIKKRAGLESIVVAIAIGTIAVEVMSHWLNRGLPIAFPRQLLIEDVVITIGLSNMLGGEVVGLIGSIIIVFAFFVFLNRSMQGRVLRAVAQNPHIARVLGISVPKTVILSFGLGGLLAGLAATLFAMSLGTAAPSLSDNLMIKCLAILFLAGVGNLRGGVVCSIILGVVESLAMGYLPGDWTNAIAFSVVVLVLLFKPQGIFGEQH